MTTESCETGKNHKDVPCRQMHMYSMELKNLKEMEELLKAYDLPKLN